MTDLGSRAAFSPPGAPGVAESRAGAPEGDGEAVAPETPGERLDRELSAFLPGFRVARVMVLAEEYAAAMIEAHARPGRAGR